MLRRHRKLITFLLVMTVIFFQYEIYMTRSSEQSINFRVVFYWNSVLPSYGLWQSVNDNLFKKIIFNKSYVFLEKSDVIFAEKLDAILFLTPEFSTFYLWNILERKFSIHPCKSLKYAR